MPGWLIRLDCRHGDHGVVDDGYATAVWPGVAGENSVAVGLEASVSKKKKKRAMLYNSSASLCHS